MPATTCPRCRRANPADAFYCHFDGSELRPSAGTVRGGLPYEFIFPSGRRCRTYDDLVQGCHYEWDEARGMLKKGVFESYLTSIGRIDLARVAQEALGNPDDDVALHEFVAALPVGQVQGPRLELSPRRLALTDVRSGENRISEILVSNSGKGILQGKVTLDGGRWVELDGADAEKTVALKAPREQTLTLRIDTRGLAGPKTYHARLIVVSNGGVAEVPLRLDIAGLPFPKPPFRGITTSRDLAKGMKENTKAAVPLLVQGDVKRWFAANGWTYPVDGPTAKGVAAVQQFFEGLRLIPAPPVEVAESDFRYLCVPPEVVPGRVIVRSAMKKWVYAHADSDAVWLRLPERSVSGVQKAVVPFEVDSSLLDEGRIYEGRIALTANAGQRLTVRVVAEVRPGHKPFTRRLLDGFRS